MMRLSVILIARNQAGFVPRLVQSVLDDPAAEGAEVVLVDSASTDGTAACACRYPIRVLRLRDEQLLTAAAARRAGTAAASGDAILFLDGDMVLCTEWLEAGLHTLAKDPMIGCVTGNILDADRSILGSLHSSGRPERLREARYAGGAALYRREALDRAGGFNPYLHSDEEPELGVRLRASGYRILRTETPIALHLGVAEGSVAALLARRRRNLYLGAGETLRYLAGSPFFWTYIRERGYGLAPAGALVAGVGCLVASLVLGTWIPALVWFSVAALALLGDLARRRSPRRTLRSLLHRLFIVEGMLRGLTVRRLEPAAYPSPETLQ